MKIKTLIGLIIVSVISNNSKAQDSIYKFSNKSITTAIGFGFIDARSPGIGYVYEVGYQQDYWKSKLRFNPYIQNGEYTSFGITDVRSAYFRNTIFGLKIGLDLLKYKAVSIATQLGYGLNYTRGIIGTGGEFGIKKSEFFAEIHHTVTLGAGLRVNPKNQRMAYEFHLLNFGFGNDYFSTAQLRFGIDIKL
jgi:hypothetical protein